MAVNMKQLGIIKSFDKLGRIVIPKELRERYMLKTDVEVVATKHGVLIRNPEYSLVKIESASPNPDRE